MRLLELHLDGFGRLVERTFAFSPGLNLIYGPNEAGKSTLQQAILALLYGFFDRGSIKAAKRAVAAAWQPWQPDVPYGGRLRYALDNGQAFEVARVFAPRPSTCLVELRDGAAPLDVTGQYRSASQGRLFFTDAQLGLSKTVFENTCTVRQAELVALEGSATAITDTLTRLAASSSADTSVTDALATLGRARKAVGSDRAWTRLLPQARERLDELERERTTVQQARHELFTHIREQQHVEAQVQALEDDVERWQYFELAAEVAEIRGRIGKLDNAQAEVTRWAADMAQRKAWGAFPIHLRDDVLRLSERWGQMHAEYVRAQPLAEQARAELAALRSQVEMAEAQISDLEDARPTPVHAHTEIQSLTKRWVRTQETAEAISMRYGKAQDTLDEALRQLAPERIALASAVAEGQAGLARAQQQIAAAREQKKRAAEELAQAEAEWARTGMSESQFQELEKTVYEIQSGVRPEPEPRRGCRSWLVTETDSQADPTPTEFVIYSQIKPLYTAMIQARADDQRAAQVLEEGKCAIATRWGDLLGAGLSDTAFSALGARLERYSRVEAGLTQQQTTVTDLRTELSAALASEAQALDTLRTTLTQLGIAASNIEKALAEYERQCQRHTELLREEALLNGLRLRVQEAKRIITEWQDRQQSLDQAEMDLCALLNQAEITCAGALENALAQFSEGVGNWHRWSQIQTEYEVAVKHRDALLEQGNPDTLATDVNIRLFRIAPLQEAHPEWAQLKPDQTPQHYRDRQRQIEQQGTTERERLIRLRDETQRTAESLRHPAEIDEEITSVRDESHRLEQFRDALDLASTELTQANHEFQKQFAPKLEGLMRSGLRQVTDGRYAQASIDATSLSVSLLAPECDDRIDVERLSTGTRDLVYLMLRMSIAQLMSGTAERLPLILDDPLVQYDSERQHRAVDFLLQAAEETQVIFFTKDEGILAQVEQLGRSSAECRVLRLALRS